ncbi:hypothetical protein ABIE26_002700 [Pedobacter africanus]|uniref:Uncharacterized protein n=1 Tax=Pedobacter africanus TaxID=151894 RepID=A0ACC6KXF6_9SPHI|nr:hypothetical protein [Pedobacter africanus]
MLLLTLSKKENAVGVLHALVKKLNVRIILDTINATCRASGLSGFVGLWRLPAG